MRFTSDLLSNVLELTGWATLFPWLDGQEASVVKQPHKRKLLSRFSGPKRLSKQLQKPRK
jgi:hypothetical protein